MASDDNGSGESLEAMLQRHRKEAKDLQGKEVEMKKAAAKGSKAEQKAKKKQAEDTIAKLQEEMKARQAGEVAALKEREAGETGKTSGGTAPSGTGGVVAGLEDLRLFSAIDAEGGVVQGRVSKAQKRRDRKAQQDTERERRIEEELSSVVSDRAVEDKQLAEQLKPHGLVVKEVKPDGHCLFRAIQDQLRIDMKGGAGQGLDFLGLRHLAAEHMRQHAEEFIPFLEAEEGSGEGELDPKKRFHEYCGKLENTAAWGGQLELQALSQQLHRPIIVYCAGKPNVEIGAQAVNAESEPLRVSYHHHAFGLGEHYNSVVKAEIVSTEASEVQDEARAS